MLRSDILLKFDDLKILSTPQRIEIAEVLLEKAQHLSAEQIIEQLRSSGSGVSKATVYNTLNLFRDRGLVRECVVDPERRFYDSTTEPHHHFYNLDTGELTDIPSDDVRFDDLPQFPENGELDSIEVVIKVRQGAAEKLD
ncbi:MAG: transcriptional repressor [Gammaproteobacteria bacterium]|nr:transcriptional repressor [Gammaproteobacteria bacterium]